VVHLQLIFVPILIYFSFLLSTDSLLTLQCKIIKFQAIQYSRIVKRTVSRAGDCKPSVISSTC
jgi:hypothetical protein